MEAEEQTKFLAEVWALVAAATPGPWFYGESLEDRDFEVSPLSKYWPPNQICLAHFYAELPSEEIQQWVRDNFKFIAASRELVPQLLELVDKLQKESDELSHDLGEAIIRGDTLFDKAERLQEQVRELEQHFSDEANSEHMPSVGDLL